MEKYEGKKKKKRLQSCTGSNDDSTINNMDH